MAKQGGRGTASERSLPGRGRVGEAGRQRNNGPPDRVAAIDPARRAVNE